MLKLSKLRIKASNPRLLKLSSLLKKAANQHDAPIWNYVREKLTASRRRRIAVNISKINRYTSEGDVVVVPGKVLSCGTLTHKVTVAAFDFSEEALRKIENSGCKALSIEDLLKVNPEGRGVKIIV